LEFFLKKWIFISPVIIIAIAIAANSFASNNSKATTFFAEALFWQIRESNATNWAQILEPNNPNEMIQFLNVSFRGSTGTRIGIGFDLSETSYNILLYYTGYKTRGTNQASTTSGQIHSAFSGNFYANNQQGDGVTGPYYQKANIVWNLTYNTLDLELGQLIKLGKLIDLRPSLGLRGGAIAQTINSGWFDPPPVQGPLIPTFTSATEKITNNFKGIGPSIGLETIFHLYARPTYAFNIIGNFSGALLYGAWTFTDIYRNGTPQTITTDNDNIRSAATMAKGYLGIGWTIFNSKANWNFRLGYEEQAWFNQLQYYSFDMGKTNDTLYLGGAALSMDVEF
jgi:hypothetical protein